MNFINPLFTQSTLTIGVSTFGNYIFWLIALLALVLSLINYFRMAKIKKILEVNASNQKSDIELIKNSIMQNRKNITINRNKTNRRQNTRKPKEAPKETKETTVQKEQNKPELVKTEQKNVAKKPPTQVKRKEKRSHPQNTNKKRRYTPRKPKPKTNTTD